jgi:hypothetical protein
LPRTTEIENNVPDTPILVLNSNEEYLFIIEYPIKITQNNPTAINKSFLDCLFVYLKYIRPSITINTNPNIKIKYFSNSM